MKNVSSVSDKLVLETGDVLTPKFDSFGLITAVVQDGSSGEILMLAHMNKDALDLTISSNVAHFWSRSRQQIWKKGETSGNILAVHEIRIDCDQDAIVLRVTLQGDAACHTGKRSCFYRSIEKSESGIRLARTKGVSA